MKKSLSLIALAIFAIASSQAEAGTRTGEKNGTVWKYQSPVTATANASTRVLAKLQIAAVDFKKAELEQGVGPTNIGGGQHNLTGEVGKSIGCQATETKSALNETFNYMLPTVLGVSPLHINSTYDVNIADNTAPGTYAASLEIACGYSDADIPQ